MSFTSMSAQWNSGTDVNGQGDVSFSAAWSAFPKPIPPTGYYLSSSNWGWVGYLDPVAGINGSSLNGQWFGDPASAGSGSGGASYFPPNTTQNIVISAMVFYTKTGGTGSGDGYWSTMASISRNVSIGSFGNPVVTYPTISAATQADGSVLVTWSGGNQGGLTRDGTTVSSNSSGTNVKDVPPAGWTHIKYSSTATATNGAGTSTGTTNLDVYSSAGGSSGGGGGGTAPPSIGWGIQIR